MQVGRGTVIAGFRLDELIGEGGMGVVYKARQLDLDRVVALKLIQPGLSGDAEFLARFQRESRLAAAIDHPNIVPVFSAGEDQGVYFISMRFVDGTDLGEYLRSRHSPLEPLAAAQLISQVAGASTPPTPRAWCIATSSRRTSSSTQGCIPTSPTSA